MQDNTQMTHRATVETLIAQHKDLPGALMPLLHAVQDALGHVPDDVVPQIATALNLSRAEVHGVVTFYHHFRREPAGRCDVCSIDQRGAMQQRGGDGDCGQRNKQRQQQRDIASERSTTTFLPIPIDLFGPFLKKLAGDPPATPPTA